MMSTSVLAKFRVVVIVADKIVMSTLFKRRDKRGDAESFDVFLSDFAKNNVNLTASAHESDSSTVVFSNDAIKSKVLIALDTEEVRCKRCSARGKHYDFCDADKTVSAQKKKSEIKFLSALKSK